ncbi:other/AgaK1 protein kinase [Hysterangium stoloniferum]|nr:other/AgaK1 protein kinase [Hysterangium stoloniferum]
MSFRTRLAALCTSGTIIWYICRNVRIIQLDSLTERVFWTIRSWRSGYPVPLDLKRWTVTDMADGERYVKEGKAALAAWKFLEPFFISRGYYPYQYRERTWICLHPNPTGPRRHPSPSYPYARRAYDTDEEVEFGFVSLRVWPARDVEGREVMIRLVSGRTPSEELKILNVLNTERARADARNHTIHVFEYIKFDGLVFAVMPRWPNGFRHDFATVAELMDCMKSFLQCYDFLHENRIAHCDFLEQNTGLNVLSDDKIWFKEGLRDASIARYTVYDFGHSLMVPPDTVISDVRDTRFYGRLPTPPEPSLNPFQLDMYYLGWTMQNYLRVIESSVPELGTFFDTLVNVDADRRPTAQDALTQFKRIYDDLTTAQLSAEVSGRYWRNGVMSTLVRMMVSLITVIFRYCRDQVAASPGQAWWL